MTKLFHSENDCCLVFEDLNHKLLRFLKYICVLFTEMMKNSVLMQSAA